VWALEAPGWFHFMKSAEEVSGARGVRADTEAEQQLKAACRNFVQEAEPGRKNEAGRDLIRAIFGKDSIAEGSVF
jgi:hypothetical protein